VQRVVGATLWSVTDQLSASQLATLQQLDPRLQYEIKVAAKWSATDDDVTSDTKLISFGREPGKHGDNVSPLPSLVRGRAELEKYKRGQ